MGTEELEKINDVISCIGKVYNLSPNACGLLQKNIIVRYQMYKDVAPFIMTSDVENDNYLFKPINGQYSLLDFLLNKLAFNIRSYDLNNRDFGAKGQYEAGRMKLLLKPYDIMLKDVKQHLSGRGINISDAELPLRITKVFIHEMGHALQTSFTDGYECPKYGNSNSSLESNNYVELIKMVAGIKDGKYSSQVVDTSKLVSGEAKVLDLGLTMLKVPRNKDDKNRKTFREKIGSGTTMLKYENLMEIFNEDESLKIVGVTKPMGIKKLDDGNYRPIYNYDSSNYSITGYAPMLKRIVGKGCTFYSMYVDSLYFAEELENAYSDISKEIFQNDVSPILNIEGLLTKIKHDKTPGVANDASLSLDLFIARCFDRKVDNYLSTNSTLDKETYDKIMQDLMELEKNMVRNNDPVKNDNLQHMIIISNIKQKLNSHKNVQDSNMSR
jgi:hypothetical protein